MQEIIKISHLIEKLQKIKEIEGDLPIISVDMEHGEYLISEVNVEEVSDEARKVWISELKDYKKYVLIS